MAAAGDVLEVMSNTFSGLVNAAAALRQVGSLGQALSERQIALNAFDTQIAQKQAQLVALDADIQNATAHAADTISKAHTDAAALLADAQVQADAAVAAGQAKIDALNLATHHLRDLIGGA